MPIGDGFIYPEGDQLWTFSKDSDVATDVAEIPGSFGLVGSDKTAEEGTGGLSAEAVCCLEGLRFAVLARPAVARSVQSKIETGEPLVLGTSYPRTMQAALGEQATAARIRRGSIESLPWRFPWLDGVFELVETGKSADANNLVCVADGLARVQLVLLQNAKTASPEQAPAAENNFSTK